MHRTTPVDSSFRGYTAGGARSVVDKVDDTKLMQEVTAHFMNRESREKVEAPQNYGFTSYTVDAPQNQQSSSGGGQQTQGGDDPNYPETGAEAFIMFVGGNRSFPVAFPIDDRRHRLKNLKQGDVAIYRLKDDRQQLHMVNNDQYNGTYWSTRDDKVKRAALVPTPQQQPSTAIGGGTQTAAPQTPGQQQQQMGQADCLDDNAQSKMYWELNKTHFQIEHNNSFVEITDDYIHCYNGNGHVYITKDVIETYYGDDSISTKVDADHVHIRYQKFCTWVNKGGCFSTVPILQAQDPDA